MKKKICIIGGGIFGSSIYIKLKLAGYDCHLIESKNSLLKGATTNNLNRIHFGFHYPRDPKTTQQSKEGYRSFSKFYKDSIIKRAAFNGTGLVIWQDVFGAWLVR